MLENTLPRLPRNASTEAEVLQYFRTRARQLLHEGYRWNEALAWAPGFEGKAYETKFTGVNGNGFVAYYILEGFTRQGIMRKLVAQQTLPILTIPDCGIESALGHLKANFRVAGRLTETMEYRLIEKHYADMRAKRSQVFLMNHIDEGLAVMAAVGASEQAMRAFCLHPLLQDDASLSHNFSHVADEIRRYSPNGVVTLALAMEYRSVANEYLAHCPMRAGGIRLSPLKYVNDMLIADKVQNRKDFELYHEGTHANSARLTEYFREWTEALGVSDQYAALKASLPTY